MTTTTVAALTNSENVFARLLEISLKEAEILVLETTIAATVSLGLHPSYQHVKSVTITSTAPIENGGLSVNYDLTIEEKCIDSSCSNQQVDVDVYVVEMNNIIQEQLTIGSFQTLLKETVGELCCEGCCGDSVTNINLTSFDFLPIVANDVVVQIITSSPTSPPTTQTPTVKPTSSAKPTKTKPHSSATNPTKKSTTKRPTRKNTSPR